MDEKHTLGRINRLVDGIEAAPGRIVLGSLVLFILAAMACAQLEIRQDLKLLIPETYPSIVHLETLKERMGNQTDLLVTIEGADREANRALGHSLADKMRQMPSIQWVVFQRDPTFFEDHALLYSNVGDLLELRRRVIERIREEVARELVVDLSSDEKSTPTTRTTLDEESIREETDIADRFDEYWESNEGAVMVLKARPTHGTTDLAFSRQLVADTQALIAETPTSASSARVVGDYAKRIRNVRTMEGDVIQGSAVVLFALLLCIWVYFRRLRAVPLVLVPLIVSVVAALAFASLAWGYLNIVSAFIFAVLLGLGIDFGVHVHGRYEDERHRGLERSDALKTALSTTGQSTAAGGLSTAGAFSLLALADFQGFAQFGIVAAVGILLALASVFVLMPALIVLVEKRWGWKPVARRATEASPADEDLSRWRGPLLLIAIVGVGAAIGGAAVAQDVEFEYDFRKLGPEKSARTGPAPDVRWKEALGKSWTLAPAVAIPDTLEQTESIHRQLDALHGLSPEQLQNLKGLRWLENHHASPAPLEPEMDEDDDPFGDPTEESASGDAPPEILAAIAGIPGGDGATFFARCVPNPLRWECMGVPKPTLDLIAIYDVARAAEMGRKLRKIVSIYSFVPDDQETKLALIRDMRRRVENKRGSFSDGTLQELDSWFEYLEVVATFGTTDLPAWVRDQFVESSGENGQHGRFVVIRNGGSKQNYATASRLRSAFLTLETPSGPVPVGANYFVMPEIIDTVADEGPWIIGLVLLAMTLIAFFLLRSAVGAGVVLATVLCGVLWILGLMVLLDWKANFFNLIAIPLLLGMGIDDALHIYHRYREEGAGRLGRVVRETGGAVFLTTLTTCIGFSGILFANHRGLLSLAHIAVAGMILCFFASTLVLPAILHWLDRRDSDGA